CKALAVSSSEAAALERERQFHEHGLHTRGERRVTKPRALSGLARGSHERLGAERGDPTIVVSRPRFVLVQRCPVSLAVMLGEQILAPVAGEGSPDGMNVVRAVLRLVVFDGERGAFDRVVVGLAWSESSRPCEADGVEARTLDLPPLGLSDLVG